MDLQKVRKEIDRVDSEIKKLFDERMNLADNVAKVKSLTEDKIYKPEREADIIKKLSKDVRPEIRVEYTSFVKKIIGLSRKYQYGRTLALLNMNQGIEISYRDESETAGIVAVCRKYESRCKDSVESFYGSDSSLIIVEDYDELAENLQTGRVSIGAGVLEDSVHGVHNQLNELITAGRYYINKCVMIKDAGHFYKVITFSKELIVHDDNNRLSLMLTCADNCGSLSTTLSVISDYGVNITSIHTHPYIDQNGKLDYRFYVELDAGFSSLNIQTLLFQLKNETNTMQVIGSYTE